MNAFKKATFIAMAIFAALFSSARADIAAGTYSMEFDGNLSIWDVSGTYSENIEGLTMNYTISVDPSGKVTGTGSMSMDNELGDMDMDLSFSGTVKTSGKVIRVDLNITMKMSGVAQGYSFTLKLSAKEKMEIDTETRSMVGTVSGKLTVSVKGLGSESMRIDPTDVELKLPDDMDGSWDLVINAEPTGTKGTKITGTGTMVLCNGSTYGFTLSGTYKTSNNISSITLKGVPANKSMSASLSAACTGPEITPLKLKTKALGQSLSFTGT